MERVKKAVLTVAVLAALSCLAVTTGCQHGDRGSGAGGDTGTGSGGTIDSSGTMDQGRGVVPGPANRGTGTRTGY